MHFLQRKLKLGPEAFTILRYATKNPPQFDVPKNTEEFLKRLEQIAPVFNEDGTFNGKAKVAEEYARCLVEEGKSAKALELYDAIAKGKHNLLFIHEPLCCGIYHSEELSPKKGKLGFESLWQYAKLLASVGRKEEAKPLLLEIAEKIPTKCYPIRLQNVRVGCIKLLIKLGVTHIKERLIQEEFRDAKDYQH